MKATLLTWALPLLFAGAAVADTAEGLITREVACVGCPCTDCYLIPNVTYYELDVSTVHLPVSDLY